jgi:predicted metallopeptidase
MLVKAARLEYTFGYVNIPTIYNEEQSKMRALAAIWGFIKVLFS